MKSDLISEKGGINSQKKIPAGSFINKLRENEVFLSKRASIIIVSMGIEVIDYKYYRW
jgi:hypothetical protein